MGWLPGIPADEGNIHGYRTSRPMVTCHRTYGFWPGDYSVIRGNGLAHLLIGQNEGQWVQFGPTEALMWHTNGANDGYGIEITGTNDDPFTDWQLRCMRYVAPMLRDLIGVPLTYSDGSDGWVNGHTYVGWHAHNGILTDDGTSQHTNLWTVDDWNQIVATDLPAVDTRRGQRMEIILSPTRAFAATQGVWVDTFPDPTNRVYGVPVSAGPFIAANPKVEISKVSEAAYDRIAAAVGVGNDAIYAAVKAVQPGAGGAATKVTSTVVSVIG